MHLCGMFELAHLTAWLSNKLQLAAFCGVFGHWSVELLFVLLKINRVLTESVTAQKGFQGKKKEVCFFVLEPTFPQGAIPLHSSCEHTTEDIFTNPSLSQNLEARLRFQQSFGLVSVRLAVVTFDTGMLTERKKYTQVVKKLLVHVMPPGTKYEGMQGIWIFLCSAVRLLLIFRLFF